MTPKALLDSKIVDPMTQAAVSDLVALLTASFVCFFVDMPEHTLRAPRHTRVLPQHSMSFFNTLMPFINTPKEFCIKPVPLLNTSLHGTEIVAHDSGGGIRPSGVIHVLPC